MEQFADLWTQAGQDLTGQPWPEYPRPSLRRASFFNLNGPWDFCERPDGQEPEDYPETITVPFPPESLLSEIHRTFAPGTALYYRKRFRLPEGFQEGRVLLHFGAADQEAEVTLNGVPLGRHQGGYGSFSFDVTEALRPENTLVVRVTDPQDGGILPYGKQRRRRGGMWYTPVSGLWQTVWMEAVPEEDIRALRFSVAGNRVTLRIQGPKAGLLRVKTPAGTLEAPISDSRTELTLENPRLWSPEDPYLYEAEIETAQDRVESYFALRTLETKIVDGIPRLCLNGKPYFFHGVLDQGYWSDGLFTPASPACFDRDIAAMKDLGFNTLRKHIKVEPELFYYACDRLGMVVFQDMVNHGKYRFLRDTALPTLGLQRRKDRRLHRNAAAREAFCQAMEETVAALDCHPSVCYWTIFNEGWGQFDGTAQYEALKALDPTRFVDTASGWFRGCASDVESVHVYFKPVTLPKSPLPLVLSEFGGYAHRVPGHHFNLNKNYGYRTYESREALMDGLENLYRREILPARDRGLCAAIYTQLSDVEDETNGILTYDRRVCKADKNRMRAIGRSLAGNIPGKAGTTHVI